MLDLGSSVKRRRSSNLLLGISCRKEMIPFTEIITLIWKIALSIIIIFLFGLSLLGSTVGVFYLGGYLLGIFGDLEHNSEKNEE